MVNIRPAAVTETASPYPTVDIVATAKKTASRKLQPSMTILKTDASTTKVAVRPINARVVGSDHAARSPPKITRRLEAKREMMGRP